MNRRRRWHKDDLQGITPEELQAMIRIAKSDRYALRNKCMLLVGFSFGLRVSELLNLKIENIDLDNCQIHIERLKQGKIHNPAISQPLIRTLRAYIKDRRANEFLFPSQYNNEKALDRRSFHKWFSRTAQRAGLNIAKQHPHAMRHGLGLTLGLTEHPKIKCD